MGEIWCPDTIQNGKNMDLNYVRTQIKIEKMDSIYVRTQAKIEKDGFICPDSGHK